MLTVCWCCLAAALTAICCASPPPLCRDTNDVNGTLHCDVEQRDYSLFYGPIPSVVNVVTWNIDWNGRGGDGRNEKGLAPILDALQHAGAPGAAIPVVPHVLVVTELARGCAKDNGVNGPALMAQALRMNYAYGVEYVLPGQGVNGSECSCGNAVFSAFPIASAASVFFTYQDTAFGGRAGGRSAVIATIPFLTAKAAGACNPSQRPLSPALAGTKAEERKGTAASRKMEAGEMGGGGGGGGGNSQPAAWAGITAGSSAAGIETAEPLSPQSTLDFPPPTLYKDIAAEWVALEKTGSAETLFPLSQSDSTCTSAVPRPFSIEVLQHRNKERFLTIFGTHLESGSSSFKGVFRGMKARKAQGKELGQRGAAVSGIGPVIIAGDFNAALRSAEPAVRALKAAGFRDCHGHLPKSARNTCPDASPLLQRLQLTTMDYIFASESAICHGSGSALPQPPLLGISDHLPVWTSLHLDQLTPSWAPEFGII